MPQVKCGLKSELAKLAARILISHWHENREAVGKAEQLAFSLQSILVQLQYCGGDASESRKLDKRLTFQVKDEEAKSRDGDPIESYKDAFTVWGSFIF